MAQRINEYGQPIGEPVPGWSAKERPARLVSAGRFTRIEPLDASRHADPLFAAFSEGESSALWTYMAVGPFADKGSFTFWLEQAEQSKDPLFFTIIDVTTGLAAGLASYLRIQPEFGVIEVGNITFSPALQRTAVATEAMYLMMKRVFEDMGYRRYEWKCDALNAPSCRAAVRLGFRPDGVFEQALIYKGRNRDTAWFSIPDRDWPRVDGAFRAWLKPENFAADGRQKQSLSALMGAAWVAAG